MANSLKQLIRCLSCLPSWIQLRAPRMPSGPDVMFIGVFKLRLRFPVISLGLLSYKYPFEEFFINP